MTDPFRDYHRGRAREVLGRIVGSAVLIGGIAVGVTALAAAAPEPVAVEASSVEAFPAPDAPTTLPSPAPESPPAQPAAEVTTASPLVVTGGPRAWSIDIDTTGYQAEIDQCLWVRMDLGLHAPIVGAHNYCGGSVVLEMHVGDTVSLTGTGLDGSYVVASARDARAGDIAAHATAGLDAAVILQTCYWADDGTVKLVALLPMAA